MKQLRIPRSAASIAILAAAAWLAGGWTAKAVEMTPALEKLIAAAKAEGKLEILSGGQVNGGGTAVATVKRDIKKLFGVDVKIRYTPGPPMGPTGNKIRTEFRAGAKSSTDVWTGAAAQVEPLLKSDMFRKIDWVSLYPSRIKPAMVEGEGRALRHATGIPGILYNTKIGPLVKQVKTMSDLLKPEFKGKFAVTPYMASYDVMAAKSVWGDKKMIEYVQKLSAQAKGFLGCGGEDRLATGEFMMLALDCAGSGPESVGL